MAAVTNVAIMVVAMVVAIANTSRTMAATGATVGTVADTRVRVYKQPYSCMNFGSWRPKGRLEPWLRHGKLAPAGRLGTA